MSVGLLRCAGVGCGVATAVARTGAVGDMMRLTGYAPFFFHSEPVVDYYCPACHARILEGCRAIARVMGPTRAGAAVLFAVFEEVAKHV